MPRPPAPGRAPSEPRGAARAYARYGRQRSASRVGGARAAVLAEPLERVAHAEVARRGTRRGRAGRASPRTPRSTARCRAARAGAGAPPRGRRRRRADSSPRASAAGEAEQRAPPRAGHRQLLGVGLRERGGRREQVRDAAERALERLAVRGDQPAGERGGARQRDLLAEHGAHRQLVAVDVARRRGARAPRARAGRAAASRAERLGHGVRVGVEVEQRPAALHRGAEVAQVVEPEARRDVPVAGRSSTTPGAVRQPQAAPVARRRRPPRRPGTARAAEERDQPVRVERRAVRQPQRDRAARPRRRPLRRARARSSLGRRREDLADRGVELAHAARSRPRTRPRSTGTPVVSSSTRAVCARCARASASGPAPTTATSWRWTWRSV